MKRAFGILVFLILATGGWLMAQVPAQAPLTEKEVIGLLKSKQPPAQTVAVLEQRGVDFEINPDIEKKLRKAKADDQFLEAVRYVGPAARAARAANPNAPRVTLEEGREIMAVGNELDPDRAIQMAQDFEKKFPNSAVLSEAYSLAAVAYARKNEIAQAVENGEKSLKLNPQNLRALLLLAPLLPAPQLLRNSDLDKEKKLADAETYARRALQLIDQLPKQPNQADDQIQKQKAEFASQMHSALGMVHLQHALMALQGLDREELAKAEEEYQSAVTMTDQPTAQDYYRLGEVRVMLQKSDGAIEAFTKASELGEGTMIKTLADDKIAQLKKQKAQTPPVKQ
jgi:tetratricopeptide (TPR) repeat protein